MFLHLNQFILTLVPFLRFCITSCYCEWRTPGVDDRIEAGHLSYKHEATAVKVAAKAMAPLITPRIPAQTKAPLERQERRGDNLR